MNAGTLRAVLVEPALTSDLAPLLEDRPFALLPVGNRPLIENLVSVLAEVGVGEIQICNQRETARLAAVLGDGSRWGVRLTVTQAEDLEQAWAEVGSHADGLNTVIALRMDLRISARDLGAACAQLAAAGTPGCGQLLGLGGSPLPGFVFGPGHAAGGEPMMLDVAGADTIDGLESYWLANLRAMRRHAARHHPERRFGTATFVDAEAVVSASAELEDRCLIGARARIGPRVRIGTDSVIGMDVYLGEGCEIEQTVVLPGTVLGPHLRLRRKIVDGHWMIDVPSGVITHVDDPLIIGRIDNRNERGLTSAIAERAAGAFALAAVALPVIALAAGRWLRGRRAFERQVLRVASDRGLDGALLYRQVPVVNLVAGRDDWARLPWLMQVLRGRLPLIAETATPGVFDARFGGQGSVRALAGSLRSLLRRSPPSAAGGEVAAVSE